MNDDAVHVADEILMTIPEHFPLAAGECPGAPLPGVFSFQSPRFFWGLIDPADPNDPIRRQIIPRPCEAKTAVHEKADPLCESRFTVSPRLVRRYTDRAILKVTDVCAVHCRFCFRKGMLGHDGIIDDRELAAAATYIGLHPDVEEVLITGGDPLMLADERLHKIFASLRAARPDIRLRVGTRVPVVLPSRVTAELSDLLAAFAPLRVSLHCNHPAELSAEFAAACGLLSIRGIPLLSQTVLLADVNDRAETLENLFRGFARLKITAYYLFALDPAPGTAHFRVSLDRGTKLMRALADRLPADLLPVYALDLPEGGGKVPVDSLMINKTDENSFVLRDTSGKRYFWPG